MVKATMGVHHQKRVVLIKLCSIIGVEMDDIIFEPLELNLNIDFEKDFDINDFNFSGEEEQTRIIKPKYKKTVQEKHLKYKYAQDLV